MLSIPPFSQSIRSFGRILFCLIALAGPLTIHARIVPVPFEPPSGGLPLLEDRFVSVNNEWFSALFQAESEKMNGAAFTTGTFRAFQQILYGNFDWVFIVDVDPLVRQFNQLNHDAILNAGSRREYLENFPGFYLEEYGKSPPNYDSETEKFTDNFPRPLFDFLKTQDLDNTLVSSRDYPDGKRYINKFYYNSDRAFAELQGKLRETNVVLIVGSVTSPELAEAIGLFLKQKRSGLALLDLSNIMDYTLAAQGEVTRKSKAVSAQLAKFIEALPFKRNGKIFFTTTLENQVYTKLFGPPDAGIHDDSFRYFIASPKDAIEINRMREKFSGPGPIMLSIEKPCGVYLGAPGKKITPRKRA